jgi:hypothetical protein
MGHRAPAFGDFDYRGLILPLTGWPRQFGERADPGAVIGDRRHGNASQSADAPKRLAAKIPTHRDGHGSELACSEPRCLVGGRNRDSIQKRAPVPLGVLYRYA